jgi:hypothetical protein
MNTTQSACDERDADLEAFMLLKLEAETRGIAQDLPLCPTGPLALLLGASVPTFEASQ